MIEDLGGVTSQLIGVALDAALARHRVIANNIANASTPGYIPKRLDFERQLAAASAALGSGGIDADPGAGFASLRLDALRAALRDGSLVADAQGETVELDREMVRLTENNLRYQALLEAGAKRGELLGMAIRGGRP